MPMPTLRGWWTFQNTSTRATKSGMPKSRPQGMMFRITASRMVNAM